MKMLRTALQKMEIYCSRFWWKCVRFVPRRCSWMIPVIDFRSLYGSTACGSWPLFQVLNLYTVGRTPWTGDQPVARPVLTHRITQTQNKCTQTSMFRVGFKSTIPGFERAKTVHVLDRAATVIRD
jgi:hypothetical protein